MLVSYAARAVDLLANDLLSMPDPRSAAINGITVEGSNVTVDAVIAFDTAADYGYPSTVGQPFMLTVPDTWIFASITRSSELPAPAPVTPEDIRAQYDQYGTGFPTLETTEA